jgi:Flp pilus assembly protein TadB
MASGKIRFRNPANGYEEDVTLAWLWCLLFGCLYFAIKGVWAHALISAVIALFTLGLSWLVYKKI